MSGRRIQLVAGLVGLVVALSSCAQAQQGGPAPIAAEPRAAAPKRLVAGIMGDPPTLRNTVRATGGSGSTPGLDTVEDFLNVGMTTLDNGGRLLPRLAESVPTVENGQWRVFSDGRMETVWQIKAGAQWHDGTPFTAQDLAFTLTVGRDREMALFRDAVFGPRSSHEGGGHVLRIVALSPATVVDVPADAGG